MKIDRIIQLLEANIICGHQRISDEISHAFSSDLMSDVLTLDAENILLITGLANVQIIRTAEVAEIHYLVVVRNKKVSANIVDLATSLNMVILESPYSMFKASGILYSHGLKPLY
ncbi:MAG: DRTGG domain-containing protein [Prolixibacteraceae bacterium]